MEMCSFSSTLSVLWHPVCMWLEQNTWAGVPSAPLIWMTHGNQVTHLDGIKLKLGSWFSHLLRHNPLLVIPLMWQSMVSERHHGLSEDCCQK